MMSGQLRIALAASLGAALLLVGPLPAQAPAAKAVAAAPLEGRWTTKHPLRDWTLEFTRTPEGWTGRYMTARAINWHDLQALVVTDRSVTFSIDTQPQLDFQLEVDPAGQSLSGTTKIANGRTVNFLAERGS
jgi:hypothetical protein